MTPLVLATLLATAPATSTGETLFAEAQYAAAASVFEAKWAADLDTVALAWAGRSRLRAGHVAHAVTYLARALAGDLPAELRRQALADLARARARTHAAAIQLILRDPPGRLTVVARRAATDAPALHHELTPSTDTTQHIVVLALDPGAWTIELRRGGDLRVSRTVEIQANQPPILLTELRTTPIVQPPTSKLRPRLALAGGVTGSALALVGAGLLIHGQARVATTAMSMPDGRCPLDCDLLTLRSTGAGLLGGGFGVVAGSLPALAPHRARRVVWASELSLGAAVFIAGLVTAGTGGARFNASSDASLHSAALHTTGAAFMGLGIGLATTALAGLIADAATRRHDLRATVAPTLTGVALSARF